MSRSHRPRTWWIVYRSVAKNDDEAQHFANVHNMDLAVGELMSALDRLQLTENTLVLFQ